MGGPIRLVDTLFGGFIVLLSLEMARRPDQDLTYVVVYCRRARSSN